MSDWIETKPFFETTAVAHLATLMRDGSPQSTPIWVDVDGERLVFFTEVDTLKDRNLRRDPRVAISVTGAENPYSMAFVRGEAVGRLEGDEALPYVDRISHLYEGRPYGMREGLAVWFIEPRKVWSRTYED
ncbi:PPOX class F420-dependent oxidoreductase [Microbacterium testaceum]|uniref:Pyridoxamine 5'-phosphate oxidase n=1 Tax=Microbacterium testaceum TaxID=2033 RepID=A0A147F5R1_MICTE|nr:PPOX class F420-dependent oxidoreductase [Microbacterium testaceum]KTS06218.1 pyridoxamine 5'-phosphate oxidase [Microbacterium testaceum]KTS09898.1 pyridoxamine 5'-phosphate oxidase [Microbacterium testaceum]KTS61321.1 pyridoxamine 5'-phosphate oxidase [Microbacterium testaceum]KTS91922.1 pyridoxamine 5'-phosphate oxidase [Microbacterium testaceum]